MITVQFFAICPNCKVMTGIEPKEQKNIVIIENDNKITFVHPCQNCGTKLKVVTMWRIDEISIIHSNNNS